MRSPDPIEQATRQVTCPTCLADVGRPCIKRPSGLLAHVSHNARYWQARRARAIPEPNRPVEAYIL